MNLDQCLGANRPLTFVISESDTEVLQHLSRNYPENAVMVYSTTLAGVMPLKNYLNPKRTQSSPEAQSTVTVLDGVLSGSATIAGRHYGFTTFVFLDCESYITDPQVIRKIKDVLHRYQIDEEFTVNLVMVSQRVCVPAALERLSEVVVFDLPTEARLQELSEHLTKKLELKPEAAPTPEVVNNLKGLTLFEVEQAYLQSHNLFKKIELPFIRQFKKSAISKTDLLSLMETNLTFNDLGGLDRLKEWIRKSAGGWTVKGKEFGLPLLKGVLLVGLPGCGKSLGAKILGNEWGLPVVEFDPSRVFSSRVGDSETNMRRVLQIVENMAPCILVVDEIEKGLAGLQSSTYSDSGVTARVIRSFLVWLQECNKPVFTVATANNISALPPELISRFDETFFVNLPQKVEREDIFKIHISKINRDPSKFDLPALAEASARMSGREIEQALKEAMYDCFYTDKELSTGAILTVLAKKTTVTTTMAEQLQKLMDWVGFDKEKGDGLRARYASTPDPMDIDRVKGEIDNILKDIERKPPDDKGMCPG